jgi:isoleucyl-tRNA synthetase
MPELERYVLHLLATLDAELKDATDAFEFNRYARALSDFANNDLSAFFFDIRKDSLYCDAPSDLKRRAYRTVLDTLFHALVRYAAPILCFTAEEVWGTRYPDASSVHLLTWPEVDAGWQLDEAARTKWADIRSARRQITEAIEPLRRSKEIGSSLQAQVALAVADDAALAALQSVDMAEISITALVTLAKGDAAPQVTPTSYEKCGRCWRHLPEVETEAALCDRCDTVVNG